MTALEATLAMEKGIKKVLPAANVVNIPLADGGEGTVQALVDSMDGKVITHTVTGPLGEQVEAHYGIIQDSIAVIEIAAAAGLHIISPEDRNPMKTTTYGVGELILHALNKGIDHFIIGLGGSGTNDGGIGMAQALGAEITDKQGNPVSFGGAGLAQVSYISTCNMDKRLQSCTFEIACDVENPLTGPKGASFVYGPQKGADAKTVSELDEHMKRYADILQRDLHIDATHIKGAGAAGGLGAAFIAFFDATLHRGIDVITKITHLEDHIKNADFVLTGEGKIDHQTMYGKTLVGVAQIAKKYDVPVIAITGSNQVVTSEIYRTGIQAIFSIVNEPMSLQEAMERSEALAEKVTENIFRLIVMNGGKLVTYL